MNSTTFHLVTLKSDQITVIVMHTWTKFKFDPLNGSLVYHEYDFHAYVLCNLWPLTYDPINPKSDQIIVTPTCIQEPSFKLICHTALHLCTARMGIFMYIMTSVTFDPPSPNLIRSLMLQYPYMHLVWSWAVQCFFSYLENKTGMDDIKA